MSAKTAKLAMALGLAAAMAGGCAGGRGEPAAPAMEGAPLFGPQVTSIDVRKFTCERPCPDYTAGRMIQATMAALRPLGWRISGPPIGPDGRILGGYEMGQSENLATLTGTIRLETSTRGDSAAGTSRQAQITLSATIKSSGSSRQQAAFLITRSEPLAGDSSGLSDAVVLKLIRAAAADLATQIGSPSGRQRP
jgi:hypothetical protein